MADLAQLERALIKADAAGDTAAARTLAGEIRRMRGAAPQAAPLKMGKDRFADDLRETMQGTDWGTRNIAGAGTALRNVWEGGKQLFGLGDPDAIEQQRIIAQEAPVGAIAGSVATFAPLAMVPGANTVAGGAALGALTGAMQPTMEGESRLANTAIGGVVGGAVPAAIRTGKTAKAALVDPFTDAGRQRIAGGVLNRTAGDPRAAVSALRNTKGKIVDLTSGQAADDAGIAALERATRAANPGAFDLTDQAQRGLLADAVRGIAKDDAAKAAAVAAREAAVKPIYDAAKRVDIPVDATFEELAKRPALRQAMSEAGTNAANRGKQIGVAGTSPTPSGVLDASGNMIMSPGQPGSLSGSALHEIKMALDAAKDFNPIGGANKAQSGAVSDAAGDFSTWLHSVNPAYKTAKNVYSRMSRPINQMDIGQEFAKRLMPALYRDMDAPAQLNAAAFARALTDQGDDIARGATGMQGARLASIMEPDQLQTLRNVAADLQKIKAAENAGRGVGSDTVQKTAMSHIAAQAGIPNWMADVARVPGGWMKQAGGLLYGRSDDQVRQIMAEMLKNPQEAAKAMQAAGVNPSVMAELLARGTQGAALSAVPAYANSR